MRSCLAAVVGIGVLGGFCFFGVDGCFKGMDRNRQAEAMRLAQIQKDENDRLAALTPEQRQAEDKAKADAEAEARAADERKAKREAFRQAEIEARRLSMKKYNAIATGMTYDDVIAILGNGEELSRVELGGIQTVMFMWKEAGGIGNMNVTFQQGRVVSKAQFGLR